MLDPFPSPVRQLASFFGVGALATLAHYAVLISLVETGAASPTPAAGAGACVGAFVSYALNRTHTFASDRPHREAGWRFAVVALLGIGLTLLLMHLLVDRLGAPYLPAQLLSTGAVLFINFALHRSWTFAT